MNKSIALLPMLLLLIPGFLSATQLTARRLEIYLPLVMLLMVATAINLWMIKHHRAKQEQKH